MITCVCCKQLLSEFPEDARHCPRCGADNRFWFDLQRRSSASQLAHFYQQVRWTEIVGIAVLLASLVMIVVALLSERGTLFWAAAGILSPILAGMFGYLAYSLRWRIREYEWLRQARRRWRPSTLWIAILCLVLAVLLTLLLPVLTRISAASAGSATAQPVSIVLPTQAPPTAQPTQTAVATSTAVPQPTPTIPPQPTPGHLPLTGPALSIGFQRSATGAPENPWIPTLIILIIAPAVFGIGLIADLSYAHRLNNRLPRPIFADRARMARVIRREAEIVLEAGRKSRDWSVRRWYSRYHEGEGRFHVTEEETRDFFRTIPPENIAAGIWDTLGSQENIVAEHVVHAPQEAQDGWRAYENRPGIEVKILQMRVTDLGGMEVELAVLEGESEKVMRQGDSLVNLRLQGIRHYNLVADVWGWPLELRDTDDYRLVQLVRRDVSIIEPPEPIALPKLEDTR
jgi:hypothetical protein